MTWLAQIGMFVVFGLLATPSEFPRILLPAIALGVFLIFVARPVGDLALPLAVPLPARGDDLHRLGGLARRGVAAPRHPAADGGAAARARISSTPPSSIVLVSLVVQGWTIRPMARQLGLIIPPTIGPVDKVELELPGTAHHELVVYHVVAGQPGRARRAHSALGAPLARRAQGPVDAPADRRPHRGRRPPLPLHRAAQHPPARPALRQPRAGRGGRQGFLRRVLHRHEPHARRAGAGLRRRAARRSGDADRRLSASSGSAARPRSATACRSAFWS